uniref:Uncharacterized protein n=1 Tax=Candidatus Kentrum sp. LPFa TaxID=2126335 RepID=A0A450Y561_9GAMM|nr:MAG: hypothetical protein BECKLPF1236A_GA0070988_106802 [Candidatus Kentron sp. LPFa]VFK36668.1 MAG: hypothetical protein BECKLPF1236C_GA0070990_106672 [Candidatus Kentron sp. LPFa]
MHKISPSGRDDIFFDLCDEILVRECYSPVLRRWHFRDYRVFPGLFYHDYQPRFDIQTPTSHRLVYAAINESIPLSSDQPGLLFAQSMSV